MYMYPRFLFHLDHNYIVDVELSSSTENGTHNLYEIKFCQVMVTIATKLCSSILTAKIDGN